MVLILGLLTYFGFACLVGRYLRSVSGEEVRAANAQSSEPPRPASTVTLGAGGVPPRPKVAAGQERTPVLSHPVTPRRWAISDEIPQSLAKAELDV